MTKLSIRNRIYLICAVPLMAFIVMAAINVYQKYELRREILDMEKNLQLFSSVSRLIGDLQYERGKTAMFATGNMELGVVQEQRKKTDEALHAMFEALRDARLGKIGSRNIIDSIPGVLAKIRKESNRPNLKERDQVIRAYSDLIKTLFPLLSDIVKSKTRHGFSRELTSMLLLEAAQESAGQLRANVSSLLGRGTALSRHELAFIINLKSGIETSLSSPALILSKTMRERLDRLRKSPDWLAVNQTFQLMVIHAETGNFQTSADDFWKHACRQVDDLGGLIGDELTSIGSKQRKIVEEVNKSLSRVVLILLAAIACTLFLTLKTSLHIIRGLRGVVESMHDIAEGEGDLTQRLAIGGDDEIGEISRSFNRFVEKIQAVVIKISGNAVQLRSSSEGLLTISNQLASGGREIFEKASTVADAAGQTSSNTGSVAESMEQMSVNISSVASATEEMSATIGEIAANSERARANSAEVAQQAERVSEMVKELGQAAREIGYVTEAITNISAQTNLLALNATIEAARAGAAGKGFAVVANEIKELSRQTATATEDIKGKITSVQASTDVAITEITKISEVIIQVRDIVSNTAAAIEEQSVVTRDVASNIAQASMRVRSATEQVGQMAIGVQTIAGDISQVSRATGDIRQNGAQVQSSAGELSGLAGQLKDLVAAFRI